MRNFPYPLKTFRTTVIVVTFGAVAGCATTEQYRESADRETYAVIEHKDDQVPGMEPEFTIEADPEWDPLADLPILEDTGRPIGPDAETELGAAVVSLEKALNIAVNNSRTYQDQKEALFLSALQLTLERDAFKPTADGVVQADFAGTTNDEVGPSQFTNGVNSARAVADGFETLTGTPADLLNAYLNVVESAGAVAGVSTTDVDIVDERTVSASTSFGVSQLLKGGGLIALNLTSNFLRFVTGDPGTATASVLDAVFVQPLWQGRGAKIAAERLTQAERDVLYALRDYTRFRKEFIVRIANSYYNVLQSKDVARNNWQSYTSFLESVKREAAYSREGRRTQADLGRLEQAALDNRNRWVNSYQNYQDALDRLKIELGLATDAAVVLEDDELSRLLDTGIEHPTLTAEDAIEVALASRLDYMTAVDQVDDAERQVVVAADALKPGLDLVLGADVASFGEDNFQELDFRRLNWSVGLDLDLPLERTAERNAFRASLISQARSVRQRSLAEDTVKLEVRDAWRQLQQARLAYEIALKSVELSARRVREQEVLAEVDRGTAIDLVDAQNDLTAAQNSLTSALINHTIARLEFWRDMGILYINKDGRWEDVLDQPVAAPVEPATEGAPAG